MKKYSFGIGILVKRKMQSHNIDCINLIFGTIVYICTTKRISHQISFILGEDYV